MPHWMSSSLSACHHIAQFPFGRSPVAESVTRDDPVDPAQAQGTTIGIVVGAVEAASAVEVTAGAW